MRSSIEGQIVAIDDGGPTTPHHAIAAALADELAAVGAKPVLLRGDGDPPPSDRAREANELDAAACVSLHPASAGGARLTCSYFGSTTTHSPAGRHLAELALEELESATGCLDALERLTDAIVRETRMPAVRIEISLAEEASSTVARAVAAAVTRYFAG
jgi:N-acetylmuramoyl-L-alanine amidase